MSAKRLIWHLYQTLHVNIYIYTYIFVTVSNRNSNSVQPSLFSKFQDAYIFILSKLLAGAAQDVTRKSLGQLKPLCAGGGALAICPLTGWLEHGP